MQNQYYNHTVAEKTTLTEVKVNGEIFYKISNVDKMRPFFMTIVSNSDHWLFVASNGGITAGRKNPEYALFPYYTDDKVTASAEHTGSKTILRVVKNGETHTWEPFSIRSETRFNLDRNIYKSRFANKIIFEEINADLEICFQYEWNTSDRFGFVRKANLLNRSLTEITITILDGLQNILPYGVGSDLQNAASNLADAYKRSELLPGSGLGIFALSAIIVDKAEPSEALKANVVWSAGLDEPLYLLSSSQLENFRNGENIRQETDVKGEKGAYFILTETNLLPAQEKNWLMAANVNLDQAAVVKLDEAIRHDNNLVQHVLEDIETGTKNLLSLTAAADALQFTADSLLDTRHFSNVLFNIMRGGIFDDNYSILKNDLISFVEKANKDVYTKNEPSLQSLPEVFSVFTLKQTARSSGDADYTRLATEYLPLKFSRRHGDPSRPWNKFSINTRSEIDGAKILDYEGNWRDIFQNWEALAFSFPAFIEGMIFKFLNASTFDGYNPYRITKDGFDWETIEPDNPWSYIGYWGDHQIIYLLKFMEFAQDHYPQLLGNILDKDYFVYANVPYTIKPYNQILLNPKETIEFDHKKDSAIRNKMLQLGSDGALLTNNQDTIHHVNFVEKILAALLAKLSNLVPGGGIWMNTQRPEWNDANNALVGNGLSMVTLCYLRRFLNFLKPIFDTRAKEELSVSAEVHNYFINVLDIFKKYAGFLPKELDNVQKKAMLDELGEASSKFRGLIYDNRFSGEKSKISGNEICMLIDTALQRIDHSIQVNKREDDLYHTYNILSYNDSNLEISHLNEMLEGQVAALSSGLLSADESLSLLDALKNSSLYREDQRSYILYPNKSLPKFLQKNNIPEESLRESVLLNKLLSARDNSIIVRDIHGNLHFNGNFRNASDAEAALNQLDRHYQHLVEKEKELILKIFEEVFNHKAFTGRSGTFFGYEGLGSIYWHMVSKLLLAVQETCMRAIEAGADQDVFRHLAKHYYDIKEGIGVHKPPSLYGAFPTDPYSHTPLGKGAQQPGMTGQVKEDIICRYGELGISVKNGRLLFSPALLKKKEFLLTGRDIEYINLNDQTCRMSLDQDSLLFTYCQTPVLYSLQKDPGLLIEYANGSVVKNESKELTPEQTGEVFCRNGNIQMIRVFISESLLLD